MPIVVVMTMIFGAPAGVAAQTPAAPAQAPTVAFLTDYRFHLDAAAFATGSPRFRWTANFGGDLDLVDYRRGRVYALANYEVVVGREFRTVDPNQGNYTLDVGASYRLRRLELSGLFHHVSRHLSDRARKEPTDWNMVGLRVGRTMQHGRSRVEISGQALATVLRSAVDYEAELRGGVRGMSPVGDRVFVMATGEIVGVTTDAALNGRRGTLGGRFEGGLRILGEKAALEIFAATERRIDPFPEAVGASTWSTVGFRLVHR